MWRTFSLRSFVFLHWPNYLSNDLRFLWRIRIIISHLLVEDLFCFHWIFFQKHCLDTNDEIVLKVHFLLIHFLLTCRLFHGKRFPDYIGYIYRIFYSIPLGELIHVLKNCCEYMSVSKNRGGPLKSSILNGLSIIKYQFWGTPIFGNTHITAQSNLQKK